MASGFFARLRRTGITMDVTRRKTRCFGVAVEAMEGRLLLDAGLGLSLARSDHGARGAFRLLAVHSTVSRPRPWSPDVTLIGFARPGTTLTVSAPGQDPVTQVVGSSGRASFPVEIPLGRTPVTIVASNGTGQSVTSRTALIRTPMPQLPRAASSFVGMSFQPYVKQWAGKTLAFFNSYGSGNASVANQVALIAPFYSKVATYSAGYASYYPVNQPYNKLDSTWEVASAAADLNKAQKKLVMTVSQGIYQQTNNDGTINPTAMNAEINDAFQIVTNANKIYPGTVTRLIFTNEYVKNAAKTSAVDAMVLANKAKANAMGIQVGVRAETFGVLTDSKSPYLPQMQKLVKDCDFIMLNIYPSDASVQQGADAAVKYVATTFQSIKAAALKVNPNVKVIMGETGWPSQGIAFNDLSGKTSTIANEKAYMTAFARWANANKIESYPFEAIDEPWKSNQKQPLNAPEPWKGPNGAEGHYGIWTYSAPDNSGKFSTKFPPP